MPGFGGAYSAFDFNDLSTSDFFTRADVFHSMSKQNDFMPLDLPLCSFETEEAFSSLLEQPNQINLGKATALDAELPLESDERQKGSLTPGITESHSTKQLRRQNNTVFSDMDWEQYVRFSPSPRPSTSMSIRSSDRLNSSRKPGSTTFQR